MFSVSLKPSTASLFKSLHYFVLPKRGNSFSQQSGCFVWRQGKKRVPPRVQEKEVSAKRCNGKSYRPWERPLPNFQNLASFFSMRFIDKVVDAFSNFSGGHSKSNNLPVGWGSYPARFTAPLCPNVPKCAQGPNFIALLPPCLCWGARLLLWQNDLAGQRRFAFLPALHNFDPWLNKLTQQTSLSNKCREHNKWHWPWNAKSSSGLHQQY